MSSLIDRLQDPLVMSKFLSESDLYREQNRQRQEAADKITEQAATIERMTAFIEELRDYKPEIHSGRMADPQDDVPDVIEAETFLLFQEDATTLLNKEPTS